MLSPAYLVQAHNGALLVSAKYFDSVTSADAHADALMKQSDAPQTIEVYELMHVFERPRSFVRKEVAA